MEKKVRIRRKSPTAAYSGSLIQQSFGESICKGYLLWDTDTCEHERVIIPNDYGFAKIDISKGEDIEERIDSIEFSNNKRKTKIYITWEDYEENYSLEKENQIKKLIKDKHGCESVRVEFKEIRRDVLENTKNDITHQTFEELFKEYINDGDFDVDDDLMKELIEFSTHVDDTLEIDENKLSVIDDWELNSIEISNILSFDKKPTKINIDSIGGLTGIFGKNFNGKSNVIKAIVWGLYKEIIGGSQNSSKYLVNIYTDSDTGYVKLYLTINGEKYRINRQITSKNGKNTFKSKYEKLHIEYNEDGDVVGETWVDKVSDKKTAEQKEVQQLIKDTIGSFDDFTKTSLQTQGGNSDYINQQQQPKNNLISRFLGLESFKERYEYAKSFFNDVKRKQKELGNAIDIENEIKEIDLKLNEKNKDLDSFNKEKTIFQEKQNTINNNILELTKNIERLEVTNISDKNSAEIELVNLKNTNTNLEKKVIELSEWLSNNFKKELPFNENESLDVLNKNLENENSILKSNEELLTKCDNWMKDNPYKNQIDISNIPEKIKELNDKLLNLKSKLTTYQGKNCPTCGSVQQQSNPEMEKVCLDEIKTTQEIILKNENKIKEFENITTHNGKVEQVVEKINNLKESIKTKKEIIKIINSKINIINNSKDIILHNQEVENKSNELSSNKLSIDNNKERIKNIEENITKYNLNIDKIKNNNKIQGEIDSKKETAKSYQLSIFNLDKNITQIYGEIRVLENNKENIQEKLNNINNSERLFKKYSIYTQAVHRDGIPSAIIRKKLPIINSKINSILSEVVDFKIELEILPNGDIIESFFFSEDKSDALPLSSASGSQKFIASIVITEALRYMSRLTKPSLRIIDEGFGTLDNELTLGVVNILNYLRNKYKNVFIITHRNEIKDFADNIIEVSKVTDGLDKSIIENNPKAGISKIKIN